jgi:hypothetical protein
MFRVTDCERIFSAFAGLAVRLAVFGGNSQANVRRVIREAGSSRERGLADRERGYDPAFQ